MVFPWHKRLCSGRRQVPPDCATHCRGKQSVGVSASLITDPGALRSSTSRRRHSRRFQSRSGQGSFGRLADMRRHRTLQRGSGSAAGCSAWSGATLHCTKTTTLSVGMAVHVLSRAPVLRTHHQDRIAPPHGVHEAQASCPLPDPALCSAQLLDRWTGQCAPQAPATDRLFHRLLALGPTSVNKSAAHSAVKAQGTSLMLQHLVSLSESSDRVLDLVKIVWAPQFLSLVVPLQQPMHGLLSSVSSKF